MSETGTNQSYQIFLLRGHFQNTFIVCRPGIELTDGADDDAECCCKSGARKESDGGYTQTFV